MSRRLLEKMIPAEFAAILKATSPASLRAFDLGGLIRRLPVLMRRWLNHEGAAEVRIQLKHLVPSGVVLEPGSVLPGPRGFPHAGERLLELFFRQLRNPRGVFLDFRPARFRELESKELLFLPNGLWVAWSEEFRRGLVDIYVGLVEIDHLRIGDGFRAAGVMASPSSEKRIAELANDCLGEIARGGRMRPRQVAEAFEKFLSGVGQEGVVLPGPFAELGICLLTLQQHLSLWDVPLDVGACLRRSEIVA